MIDFCVFRRAVRVHTKKLAKVATFLYGFTSLFTLIRQETERIIFMKPILDKTVKLQIIGNNQWFKTICKVSLRLSEDVESQIQPTMKPGAKIGLTMTL